MCVEILETNAHAENYRYILQMDVKFIGMHIIV
jgi:hypothetical protein